MRATLQTLVVALGLGKRFGGVTLITVDRWTIAEELWLFGEDAIYRVALELSDHDIVRVWVLAGRLLERERLGRQEKRRHSLLWQSSKASGDRSGASDAGREPSSIVSTRRQTSDQQRSTASRRAKLPGTMALIDPRENAYTFLIDS